MDIRNILVSLGPGVAPSTLTTAGNLAHRFRAKLTGFAAAEPSAVLLDSPAGIDRYAAVRAELEEALLLAKEDFEARAPHDLVRSWSSAIEDPTRGLQREALGADLIVVQRPPAGFEVGRAPDLGELVLSAGRPILLLGAGAGPKCSRIVVAWKDTREARRAVADALPFLRGADEVLLATVDEGDYSLERSRVQDGVAWLHLHGVPARGEVFPRGANLAGTIGTAAAAIEADLVVAGAYGHSRFREWLLSGMTQELLESTDFALLLSN